MAYERTVWKNREVERPRTFEKIENPDGTITLVPAEGNIIEPGTPIIAENMNNIEQGIEDAHNAIDAHKADKANPHSVTKSQVGLGNVDNNKQMPIAGGTFAGVAKAQNNTSYTTAQLRNTILSTGNPSGGSNGDIWIKYK